MKFDPDLERFKRAAEAVAGGFSPAQAKRMARIPEKKSMREKPSTIDEQPSTFSVMATTIYSQRRDDVTRRRALGIAAQELDE